MRLTWTSVLSATFTAVTFYLALGYSTDLGEQPRMAAALALGIVALPAGSRRRGRR